MLKSYTSFVADATLLLTASCAGSYHAIQPERVSK